ncbi:DUF1223 domain-containing protein [Pseudoroseicyclus tamaricis]|uniref:DUF1223 domain-containing protein n=1 Tax=Pseudoroseicyclus tamaricis TaxID=2705421 RepID=A0A6B2K048_9RHOB|nr:DUF1223 domain-containing protein [Pseudoroseicyclus tamaricis]NDV01042.1 DUF1223 domain-containing protein [Pseudoroseicyclus tamaricis]
MQVIRAGIAALLLAASAAEAQDAPVVVELYTSQGCSSCPPADALLQQLAGRDDVIALALHVDYWDYIGWEDSFAQPGFTERQRRYAHAAGANAIYTPQFVIGGQHHVIGARTMELMDNMRAAAAQTEDMGLQVSREGDVVTITAEALESPHPLIVQLVRYTPQESVDILHGENAGRSLTYANIVTDWAILGEWDGAGPLHLEAQVTGDEPLVAILQEPGPGRICAAVRLAG